ncbi:MAG: hypothetical protein ACO3FI_06250 [Cyclobacteriaceae bacterium]
MKFYSLLFIPLMWIGPCDEPFTSSKDRIGAGECIDVSLVAGICGEAVLKIETPEYQSLGESWNGHDHVFFTVIPCGSEDKVPAAGTFKVLLKEFNSSDFGDCIRCKATVAYTGEKRFQIAFISSCSG